MTDTLIKLDAVEAGYAKPIVGPISLSINRGQIVGLVGQNGSGKSTLLKAIADSARIFNGRIERTPGVTVALMEQEPVRLHGMPFNGWEYLRFAGASRSAPPSRLTSWLDQRVDSLSGGQFQLLSCWTALGSSAEVILLDEPTNNLDEDSEAMLTEILAGDHVDRAILLVSHDQAFVESVSDQIIAVGR